MFGELDDLETLFWLSYLGPGVEEESGDLDVSVHRSLHERGVHLIGLVLLVRAGVKQEPGRKSIIFEEDIVNLASPHVASPARRLRKVALLIR